MVSIIQDFIPKGRANRPGISNPMTYITIHNTGNTGNGANAKSHANYVKSDSAVTSQVSWHYTVDDKEIYQHILDNETAWHCGDGSGDGNRKSIGIEICMNADGNLQKATDNAVDLIVKLCKDHNISVGNIKQHNNWSGKNCPQMIRAGKPYDWNTFINKVKDGLQATPQPIPQPTPPAPWHNDAQWWVKANGISDGTRPEEPATRAEVWQMLYNMGKKLGL